MSLPSPFFEELLAKHAEALAGGHLIYYGAETFLVKTGTNNEIHVLHLLPSDNFSSPSYQL